MSKKYISPFLNTNNRHDFFVKQVFKTYPNVAKAFFNTHLPETLRSRINLNTLVFCDTEMFKGSGGKLIGDIIIKTTLDERDAYLVILPIEHQSSNDPLMPFRQLEYLVHILASHIQQQEQAGISRSHIKLPFVYQTVIYHGSVSRNFSNDICTLIDAPEDIVKQYFLKPYRLIDMTQISDENLRAQHEAGLLGLALKYSMKQSIHDFDRFAAQFSLFLNEISTLSEEAQCSRLAEFVLEYIMSAGRFNEARIIPAIVTLAEQISAQTKEHFMSLSDVLIEQGRQAGLEVGMQVGEIVGERKLVSRLLQKKFGSVSERHSQQLAQLTAEELRVVADKLIESDSIEVLFKAICVV